MTTTDETTWGDLGRAKEILDGSTGRWYFGIVPGSIEIDLDRQTVTFVVRWNKTGARRRITLGLEQVRGIRVDLPA